ncbi:MAG: EamA family transporter [Thermoanaerobaculia bacterium]
MSADSQPRLSLEASILFAYATVSLLWGSTYLAIRIGVQYMPPALFAASRFLLAGLMLLVYARLTSQPLPNRAVDWRTNIIVGLLLLTVGNGLVVWGEQFVESGLAAIFIVTSPLWMVLFSATLPGLRYRPTAIQLVGLVVGFVAAASLIGIDLEELRNADWRGPLAILGAAASWSLGSVYSQRHPISSGPVVNSALQMLAGGIALAVIGLVRGEWQRLEPTWQGVAAVLYLTVFGSVVAFTAYVYLLDHWPAPIVSSSTYLNVVVAVFLGWLILDETVTVRMLIATGVIFAAVAMVRSPTPVELSRSPEDATDRS